MGSNKSKPESNHTKDARTSKSPKDTFDEQNEELGGKSNKPKKRSRSITPNEAAFNAPSPSQSNKENGWISENASYDNEQERQRDTVTDKRPQSGSKKSKTNENFGKKRPPVQDMFVVSQKTAPFNGNDENEQTSLRQEQEREQKIQLQAMTNQVQMLCTLCSQQHLEHTSTDHSASKCPLEFMQYINLIEIHIDDFKRTIDDLQHEKNDYINRLSQVAGFRLTDNNPNITDLNDPNRPVKLGERLSKIYDDEWTDAMQELEQRYSHSKKKEKKHEKIVYHLYSIIKVLYKTCKQKAEQQLGHFLLLNDPSQYQVESLWSDIEPEKRKSFVENRKKIADANIKMLQNILKDDDIYKKEISSLSPPLDEKIFDYLRNSPYFEKCLEICWFFVIEDPPLYLDILPLEGKLLNKDTHKEYTKSGNIIKYTVWPALYLHCQNNTKGPLLAKGVVQPKERKYVGAISEKDQLQNDQVN